MACHLEDDGHTAIAPTLTGLGERGHPLLGLEESVQLCSKAAETVGRAFIRTTRSDLYDRLFAEACDAGWQCRDLAGGHYAMLTEPRAPVSALAGLSA